MNPVNLDGGDGVVFSYDVYLSYLNSKTWDKLRNERLAFDDYQCQICGSRSNLQVHHLCYPAHGRFGTEHISDLITLCRNCHSDIDNLRKGQTVTKHKVRTLSTCWVRFQNREAYEESEPWLKEWLNENERDNGVYVVLYLAEEQLHHNIGRTIPLSAVLKLKAKMGEDNVRIQIESRTGGY